VSVNVALGILIGPFLSAGVAAMIEIADAVFAPDNLPLDRIKDYLLTDRDDLKGCRLGRLANESEVLADDRLRAPLARYFGHVQSLVQQALEEACAAGDIST
jgi:TetR/AcrR family transcriptional regulator, transcriptional repressor for nem operon